MEYDIAIVGSGLSGSLLAVALSKLPIKVALIEAKPWQVCSDSFQDLRSLAISYGSQQILSNLGLWQAVAFCATPIANIHVSSQGQFGATRLSASESHVPALGYIIELAQLLQALKQAVEKSKVAIFCPAEVVSLTQDQHKVSLSLNNGQTLHAKLVLASDGTQSLIRRLLNIDTIEKQYEQTAIIANIGLSQDHKNVAYERFTSQGPLALLPLSQRRGALVWTMEPTLAKHRLEMPEALFLQQLQLAFGYRVGRFEWVGTRQAFPLSSMRAKKQSEGRVLLLGNAAHSLHPVAGQGFNLTMQDIAVLVETLVKQHDIELALIDYLAWREPVQHRIQWVTDNLVRLFSSSGSTALLHSIGLTQLERIAPLKKYFADMMMGVDGIQPRLVRGRSLEH